MSVRFFVRTRVTSCARWVAGVSSEDQLLPALNQGQPVTAIEFDPTQHFTQPPPRYTEASLVKMLEQLGIGRVLVQLPQQRVLAATAADDENFHGNAASLGNEANASCSRAEMTLLLNR